MKRERKEGRKTTGESKFSRETCLTSNSISRTLDSSSMATLSGVESNYSRSSKELTSGQLLSQQEVVEEVGEPRHFGVIELIRVRGWWPA